MILIKDVLNTLMEPVSRLEHTVDGLESGDPESEVSGMITTFMATQDVIEQAIRAGANLIIAHEGTFYSHQDKKGLEREDSVYQEKQKLIEQSGIAIYRFHDYLHRYEPDGIMTGLIKELEWELLVTENQPTASILTIPTMTVNDIAEHVKQRLGISYVRVIGERSMPCSRIGLLAGYRGGGVTSIPLFEEQNVDMVLYGEGPEWETPEYVRDAVHQGRKKALMVLGHAQSEEPGMKHVANTLQAHFPSIPVQFISGKHGFHII
ncbi:putative NIF3 family GTP cyclohydrolase 1 type 2 [Paenibacillus castaneae]|nr:putative NIF3 family GTP cyclohydrolase 1 type 2 [Paenibacillus castaneae]